MKRALSVALTAGVLLGSLLAPATGSAQTGKTVVVALGQEPDHLLTPPGGMYASTLVDNLIYDPLVQVDDQMQAFPGLVATIPTIDNGGAQFLGDGGDRHLEVTFNLRPGITWSDGAPLTSDDVIYNYKFMMNPNAGFSNDVEAKFKDVVKVDDLTFTIIFMSANQAKAADPETYKNQGTDPVIDPVYFFGLFDDPYIYPSHWMAGFVGADPSKATADQATAMMNASNQNPIGTGPYTLASWDPGTQIVLQSRGVALPQRLPGRGANGAPAFDTAVFRIIPAKDTSLAALEAGDVNAITSIDLDVGDSPTLDNMPGVQARYIPGTTWEHLDFNLDNPILQDKIVREAIAYGTNRQELVDVLLFGKSEPSASQIPSWSWAYNPDVPRYEYNPGLADQLLTQDGWVRGSDGVRTKGGQRLSFKYWSTGSNIRPKVLPLVKNQLAQVGIEMNIEFVTSKVYFDTKASSPQSLSARQFEVAEFAWVGGYDPGNDSIYAMHSRNIPSKENNYRGGNYAGFRHGYNDTLLDQQASNLDIGFRKIAFNELQNIWQTDLPVYPLFLRPVTAAASANLVNFRPSMSSSGETWNFEQWDLS